MNEEDNDFKDDELITIKLPRSQYKTLQDMIKREEAYSWFQSTLKSNYLWVVGGGILTMWALYDKFHMALFGTVK